MWERAPIMYLPLQLSSKLQTQHLCFRCLESSSHLTCPVLSSLSTCHSFAHGVFPTSVDGNSYVQTAYTKNTAVIPDFSHILYPLYQKSYIQTMTSSLHCFKAPPSLGYWNWLLTGLPVSLLPPYCLLAIVKPTWLVKTLVISVLSSG